MKKNIMMISLVGMMFLLCGCGSKKLECTKNDNALMDTKETVNMTFSKDELSKIDIKNELNVPEDLQDMKEAIKNTITNQYEGYSEVDGVSLDSSMDNNKITVLLSVDAKKVDTEVKDALIKGMFQGSYDNVKKNAEDNGFTCK